MPEIVALVGLPASGKSTALEAFRMAGWTCFEISEVAAWEYIDIHGVPPEGDDLREFGTAERNQYGQGIFGEFAIDYMTEKYPVDEQFAVSGIRSPGELEALETYGDLTVVHVDAPRMLRLDRIQNRGRDGEEDFDEEALIERDHQERDWGVGSCIRRADFHILNNADSGPEFRGYVRSSLSSADILR